MEELTGLKGTQVFRIGTKVECLRRHEWLAILGALRLAGKANPHHLHWMKLLAGAIKRACVEKA